MNAIRCIQSHSFLCTSWLASRFFRYPRLGKCPSSGSARTFSFKDKESITYLTDIESYVEKDFILSDLKKKFDEENFPEPVTTATILSGCETIDDVLDVLKNAALSGKLWKDEITLYFDAIRRQHKLKKDNSHFSTDFHTDGDSYVIANPSTPNLLDNPYFQVLIKEALVHSPRFTTRDLVFLLHCFVTLEIPPKSNTMLILVSVIQNRINDLFPLDVLNCLRSIRRMESRGPSYLDSLRRGLIQHLENQTVDDMTLQEVLMGTSIADRINLLGAISSEGPISPELKGAIRRSVFETINRRRHKDLRNLREAESVLRFLARSSSVFLLRSVIDYFSENVHEMKDVHKEMIHVAKESADFENLELPAAFEVKDFA